jgi:hypothetical protein
MNIIEEIYLTESDYPKDYVNQDKNNDNNKDNTINIHLLKII